MKNSDIVIDIIGTLGNPPYPLTDITEDREFRDNKPTDNIKGYKYAIVLPERRYEKLTVKIPGRKQIDLKAGEMVNVSFHELRLGMYSKSDSSAINLTAEAQGVALFDDSAKK